MRERNKSTGPSKQSERMNDIIFREQWQQQELERVEMNFPIISVRSADTFIIFMGFCCVSHTIDFVAGESEKGWGRVEVVFIVCRGREENY